MIYSLQPTSIILANLYLVMGLQLALNWPAADCNTNSSYFQLAFIAIMAARILIQEAYENRGITAKTHRWSMLVSSGFFLTGLAAYQSYMLWKHWGEFSYDASTKEGSVTCYQNRIIYVSEIAICVLTVCKDIVVVILGKARKQELI